MLDPTADSFFQQSKLPWSFTFGLNSEQGIFMIDTGYHIMQQINRGEQGQEEEVDPLGSEVGGAYLFTDGSSSLKLWPLKDENAKLVQEVTGSTTTQLTGNMSAQSLLMMGFENIDIAGYLGVLIFVNLFYLSLMLLLTWIVVHVRNNQSLHGSNNILSRQVADRVFFTNFIFLQLTLFCKLITAVIFLLHVLGIAGHSLPILPIRLFYHASCLFLCIAYFITLYQWLFIAMRVNFYGGKFGARDFKKRVKTSKLTYSVASTVIFTLTLALIIVEAFYPIDSMTQAVSMVEVCEFSGLLLAFIITGSIIIRNLYVYFNKHYNQQRHSLLAALLLTILSLVVLLLRYSLEFYYNGQQLEIGGNTDEKTSKKTKISITVCLFVILVSDLLPVVTQMLCIWISGKGKWDSLISGFLCKQSEQWDRDTYAGSVMLDNLREELAQNDYADFLSISDSNSQMQRRSNILYDTYALEEQGGQQSVHADSFFETLGRCETGQSQLETQQTITATSVLSRNHRRAHSQMFNLQCSQNSGETATIPTLGSYHAADPPIVNFPTTGAAENYRTSTMIMTKDGRNLLDLDFEERSSTAEDEEEKEAQEAED